MKILTEEKVGPYAEDSASDEAYRLYNAHLKQHCDAMSPAVLALAFDINLHDAKLRVIERDGTSVKFIGQSGDLQRGYSQFEFAYTDAALALPEAVIDTLRKPESEILVSEVVRDGEAWGHNLLLWPAGVVSVRFTDLSIKLMPSTGDKRFEDTPFRIAI